MKVTYCDNCEKILKQEKNEIELYAQTIYTITEEPGNSPFRHSILDHGQNLVKHFCSKDCIGRYYESNMCACGTHTKDKHCHNIAEAMANLNK